METETLVSGFHLVQINSKIEFSADRAVGDIDIIAMNPQLQKQVDILRIKAGNIVYRLQPYPGHMVIGQKAELDRIRGVEPVKLVAEGAGAELVEVMGISGEKR